MSLEEHRGGSSTADSDETQAGSLGLNEMGKALAEEGERAAGRGITPMETDDGEDASRSSASNVIPTDKIANGLSAAKGIWDATLSRAKKGMQDINQSPAMESIKEQFAKVNNSETMKNIKEKTAPVVSAVGSAVVEGAKFTGEKIKEGAEAAKPHVEGAGLKIRTGFHDAGAKIQPVMEQIGHSIADAAEKSRPALEKAGTAIKTTAVQVGEHAKPVVDKVGTAVSTYLKGDVDREKPQGGGSGTTSP